MQIRYVGHYDEVEVPALGLVVKQGEVVDVDDDVAGLLLDQATNWQAVTAAAGRKKKEA